MKAVAGRVPVPFSSDKGASFPGKLPRLGVRSVRFCKPLIGADTIAQADKGRYG